MEWKEKKRYFAKLATMLCESNQATMQVVYDQIFDYFHSNKFEYVLEIDLHNLKGSLGI